MSTENKKIAELKENLAKFYDKVGALTRVQRLMICLFTFAIIGGGAF